MSNFLTRTITGALFIVFVIGSAILDFHAFAVLFGIFLVFGDREFYRLVNKVEIKPYKTFGIITGLSIYFITALNVSGYLEKDTCILFYFIVFSCAFLLMLFELFTKKENPFHDIAYTLLGIIYIAIPLSMLITLVDYSAGKTGILTFPVFYFFIIWTNDVFAYLIGSSIGKHHLLERISPKKSWEGAIGAFIVTLVLAFFLSEYYTFLTLFQWLGLTLIIVVFGTFGDLVESMLKRSVHCKDSGVFFPGHGGILDRFDSILFSAPFVYTYLKILAVI